MLLFIYHIGSKNADSGLILKRAGGDNIRLVFYFQKQRKPLFHESTGMLEKKAAKRYNQEDLNPKFRRGEQTDEKTYRHIFLGYSIGFFRNGLF